MRIRLPVGRGRGRRPSRALLANYLAEARALADRGGGTLAVVEPARPAVDLTGFARDVARHVAAHGVRTGDVRVVAGSTTVRIAVLAHAAPAPRPRRSADPTTTTEIRLADVITATRGPRPL